MASLSQAASKTWLLKAEERTHFRGVQDKGYISLTQISHVGKRPTYRKSAQRPRFVERHSLLRFGRKVLESGGVHQKFVIHSMCGKCLLWNVECGS